MVGLRIAGSGAGTYVDWGVVHISVANLAIIVAMVVVFVAALLIPFPKPRGGPAEPGEDGGADRPGGAPR